MERETRIPEEEFAVPGGWDVDGDPIMVPAGATDQLYAALEDAATIVRHIGGAVTIAAVREKLAEGVFVTREYAIRWSSFVPAVEPEIPVAENVSEEPAEPTAE